jgi:hypothetical protein
MRGVSRRQPASSGSAGAPYRHLAVRVIDQAFRDLASPARSPADQESAREFLAGSSMLSHWCEVADLDPAGLVVRARKLIASAGRFSARAVIKSGGSARAAVAAWDGM